MFPEGSSKVSRNQKYIAILSTTQDAHCDQVVWKTTGYRTIMKLFGEQFIRKNFHDIQYFINNSLPTTTTTRFAPSATNDTCMLNYPHELMLNLVFSSFVFSKFLQQRYGICQHLSGLTGIL